jgi:hypothetical protein
MTQLINTDLFDYNKIADFHTNLADAKWEDFYKIFKFMGFDAELCIKTINTWKVTDLKEIVLKTRGELIQFCLFIACTRTVKWNTKQMNKSEDAAKKVVNELYSSGILVRENSTRDKITFQRLMVLFPYSSAEIFDSKFGKVVYQPGNVPKALCFPQGAALIPRNNEKMFKAWLVRFSIPFARIISNGQSNETFIYDDTVEAKKRLVQFARTAWNSPWVDDITRGTATTRFWGNFTSEPEDTSFDSYLEGGQDDVDITKADKTEVREKVKEERAKEIRKKKTKTEKK